MYKLYIGSYVEKGTPATWTISSTTPKKYLKKHVKEIVPNLKYGMELYIVHNNEVHAYFRDGLRKYFEEKKNEM